MLLLACFLLAAPAQYAIKEFKLCPEYRARIGIVDRKTVLWLYQILKDTHEIFEHSALTYWIDGGTLLGAMRHGGLIPWDDDLDLCILKSDKEKFENLIPIFNAHGYGVTAMGFGYKIFPFNGKPFINNNARFNYPFLDIFFAVYQADNEIGYDPIFVWGHREKKPIFYTQEELFPLTKYSFGAITVYGPANPLPYFDHLYGSDWSTMAIKYNHLAKKTERVLLRPQDKVPAQPTEPLENRIQFNT